MTKEPWLCFFDVDGTLEFRSQDPITSPKDVEALLRLKEEGHYLILNSGRSRAVIPTRLTDRIPFDGFVCGASFVEWQGKILHHHLIDGETVRAVGRYMLKKGMRAIFECEDKVYTINGGIYHMGREISDCFDEITADPEAMRVTKFTFDQDIPQEDARLFPGVRVINFGTYSEALARGYDKAFGMRLICEATGIPRTRTIAFGDSANDVEMLRFAGKSVIMAHAPAELDAFATYRAKSPVGGVAEGIETLFYKR